jgi:hypothetical protein
MNVLSVRRLMSNRWLIPVTLGFGIAISGVGYGVARADIPDSGVINACYNNQTGVLQVIDTSAGQKCSPGATALSWNQTGPAGAQGPAGPAGAAGANGQSVTLHTPDLANCPTGGVQLAISGSTADVCNGVQGPPGPAAPRLFAEMNADGTLVAASPDVLRNSNITAKLTGSPGDYEIAFDRVVRGVCAPVASLHVPAGVITPGYAMVSFTSDTQVEVLTFNASGTLADSAFDLIVMC